jgi:hypothetical protein
LEKVKYWEKLTRGNIPMLRIMDTCAYKQANIWLWHDCSYVFDNLQCHFCGIGQGMKKHRMALDLMSANDIISAPNLFNFCNTKRNFVIENVLETLETALKLDYQDEIYLMFISGNLPNEMLDYQWLVYCDLMKAINSKFPLVDLNATSVLMPPNEFNWIDKAYESGLRKIIFNLDVWNPKLFNKYCPGKSKYSQGKMLDALKYAVGIFGNGNVWTNLIIGLDDNPSIKEGANHLADFGIGVNPIVFHRDTTSKLQNMFPPTTDDVIDTTREVVRLYHKHEFLPLFSAKNSRTSIANEIYLGWL